MLSMFNNLRIYMVRFFRFHCKVVKLLQLLGNSEALPKSQAYLNFTGLKMLKTLQSSIRIGYDDKKDLDE